MYYMNETDSPMNIFFEHDKIGDLHSPSQIARVLTEPWVAENMFCPRCGSPVIRKFPNNKPVADFYCPQCGGQFELKSKCGTFTHKVNDGAYDTMIARITSNQNPDFFFMSYSREDFKVRDFMMVPKHFFVPSIIEKRKPLSSQARRAGWVGCNILIDQIPMQGVIPIISDGVCRNRDSVVNDVARSGLLEEKNIHARGWLMDVLSCMNLIAGEVFSLQDMYRFEERLYKKHPENNHIQAKIRQQLQVLRDKGMIIFLGNGAYRKMGKDV
jgi:type II restriction enzyme